ncbi:ABC transporter permease subunit [Hydrogenophaga sp.]|uniref:ABC transporter permease subunit n=1 Tax=Hydrogenophaga sp. TaxID=1904254 RepID=UPI003D288329
MNWEVIFRPSTLAMYGEGLITTLWLLLSSLGVGAVLALLFALALTSSIAPLRWLVGAYTYVIRGTPLLIQLYLIYYGLAQLDWIQARWNDIWPWTHFKEPFFCALLAFSLNTAGYTAEMIAGAIRDTAPGEIEAAQAMGMSRSLALRRIVLPQCAAAHFAGLQQRGGDDAARHQPGQHRAGDAGCDGCGQPHLLRLLPTV